MRSIGEKILRSTICWMFTIVVLLSVVSVAVVNEITKNDSEAIMTQAVEKEALRFNSEFALLEESVTTIEEYVREQEKECASEEELLSDTFCEKVQEMTLSIADRTDGAMAVYFRYDPALAGNGTQGFFWSRDNDDEDFACYEPTDILQYDHNDTEHVGWFYEPKEKGEAMWMSPYYNENLDVFMISYVIPYYTASGDFLGVIGMDIDYSKIVRLTEEVSLYKSGKVELADLAAHYIYGMDEEGFVVYQTLSETMYNHITTLDRDDELLSLTDDSGENYLTCVRQLTNGMRLMLSVPTDEIYAQRNAMLITFAAITIIFLTVTVLYIVRLTNKIVHPLKKLTEITGKYAKGDWNDSFVSDTGDEIQELSESISIMAETTRSYIAKLNQNAMTDGLTGLKNRNCYLRYIEKFKGENSDEVQTYAVAVFDINFLKRTNDGYGHEAGDKLIKLAGKYICDNFTHSPVFRIGGDEFAAILQGRDFVSRDDICKKFELGMTLLPPAVADIPLAVAYGLACFPGDGADYDDVFACADERMYAFKKKMKAARE